MDLVFCYASNPRVIEMARELGWMTGARSDGQIYQTHRPLYLLDIHWRDYDWTRHVAIAQAEHPHIAAVPDVETMDALPSVFTQMEELAPFCDYLMVIPKAFGVAKCLPRLIGRTPVILGYSVPTRYGGTAVPFHEFDGWPIHLLGGTPRNQRRFASCLRGVRSADGNAATKIAFQFGKYYDETGKHTLHPSAKDGHRSDELHWECLRRSLTNLRVFWQETPPLWNEEAA